MKTPIPQDQRTADREARRNARAMKTTNPTAAHTPGPWSESPKYQGNNAAKYEDSEWEVCGKQGPELIATINPGWNRAEANARLIASAPDLLAALENLLALAEHRLPAQWKAYSGEPNHILGNARAAILKAKGQP